METQEKVGEVLRKTIDAATNMCQNNSTTRLISGGLLERFERLTDRRVKEKEINNGNTKDSRQENNKTPLFTKEDMNIILHREKENDTLDER